jgi:RHS repeat-associated protein
MNTGGRRVRVAVLMAVLFAASPGVAPASLRAADPALPQPPSPAAARAEVTPSLPVRWGSGPVEERSAFSATVRNQDGTHTRTFSSRPMHWRDEASGRWREFENDVRPTAAVAGDNFGFESAGNGHRVRFATLQAASAGQPLVEVAYRGASLGMRMIGAKPTAVERSPNTITYVDVAPGIDVRYRLDGELVKEEIVLKELPAEGAEPELAFALSLHNLSVSEANDGSLLFQTRGGGEIFRMPKPFMFEANGDGSEAMSDGVAFAIAAQTKTSVALMVLPDWEWIRASDRSFPVIIDPTVENTTFSPTGCCAQNTFINEASPSTNYCGNSTMYVGKNSSGQRQDTLIAFRELDQLPRESAITSATMTLHAVFGSSGMGMEAWRVNYGWDQSTATWASPTGSIAGPVASRNSVVPGANNFAVTGIVRDWVRGTHANNGLRIRSSGANGDELAFFTSFWSDPSVRPSLSVTYVPATRLGLSPAWTYTSQEYGGGNTAHVNLSSGNVVMQHVSGSIPARGFEVDLVHTYNSQDNSGLSAALEPDQRGAFFGEGWSFSHGMRVNEVDSGNAAIYKDPTGRNQVFVKQTDSGGTRTYQAPLANELTLTKDINSPPADANKVWTLTERNGGRKTFFDASGKMTRREDRNGNYLTYSYNGSGRLTTITDVAGRQTVLEYVGPNGRLSKITDMAGRVSTYSYNDGALDGISHAVGTSDQTSQSFGYRISQLDRITPPRGYSSYIDFDVRYPWSTGGSTDGWVATGGATISQTNDAWLHTSGALRMTMNISNGAVAGAAKSYATPVAWSSVQQDVQGFVALPAGGPNGLAARITVWDAQTSTSGPGTHTVSAPLVGGYWSGLRIPYANVDPGTRVSKVAVEIVAGSGVSFNGQVFVDDLMVRGAPSRLTDAKSPANTLASFAYDPTNLVTTVKRPDQGGILRDWSYRYTRSGQVDRVTDPLGNVTDSAYDSGLNLLTLTMPGGSASTYTMTYFGNSNQLRTWVNELGETNRRGADTNNGDTKYLVDPLNEKRRTDSQSYLATHFTRDSAGNVTKAASNWYAAGTNLDTAHGATPTATDRLLEFTYGTGGVVTSMKDPKGAFTYFAYQTGTGYLTSIDAPAGAGEGSRRVTTITPNSDGTLQQVIDPKGLKRTYEYDNLGRLRKINYGVGSGSPFSVTYTLDSNGNMTATSDNAGSSSWSFDENNQLLGESRTQTSTSKSVSYAYYGNGMLSQISTFGGQTSSLSYDAALRLTGQTDPKDGGRTVSFGYDSRSRRTSVSYGSGVAETFAYDKADRISEILIKSAGGTNLQKFTYYYGFNSSGVRQSDYDRGNVIKLTELDGSIETYTYDSLNRLKTAVRTGTNTFNHSYSFDLNNNRTQLVSGGVTTNSTFDAANQLTAVGSTSYSYDRNGNLTAFGSNSLSYDTADRWTSGTISGSTVGFTYDGHGRRVSRTVAGSRTDFWYDRTGLTLESGATNATYLRDTGGMLLSVASGGRFENYSHDRLGSVVGLVDTAGSLANRFRYDPWGTPTATSGPAYSGFRFTGVYRDNTGGFYRMTQRYYQPGNGRFTQIDPLPQSVATVNRYHYAGCNPLRYTDVEGLDLGSDLADDVTQCLRQGLIGAGAGAIAGAVLGALPAVISGGLSVAGGAAGGAVVGGVVGCAEALLSSWLNW